jgi:hypothetical protein
MVAASDSTATVARATARRFPILAASSIVRIVRSYSPAATLAVTE